MTKADLIEEVSRVVEMTRKEAEVIVESIFDSIVRSLRGGDKIEIRGFGSFRTRQRQPRVGRNPKTGARVDVPAKKIPYFKPSKELKDIVNTSSGNPAVPRTATYSGLRSFLMDRLWSPWRYQYVSKPGPVAECIFCSISSEQRDPENYVVFRGPLNFVLLNLYPYSTGHLMIAPYEHVASLQDAAEPVLSEMMRLARRAEICLREVYRPHGFNIGMNLGEAAGAGIPGHIHTHVLPRWRGDTNFMTTVSETRVLPETLDTTYAKLSAAFKAAA